MANKYNGYNFDAKVSFPYVMCMFIFTTKVQIIVKMFGCFYKM